MDPELLDDEVMEYLRWQVEVAYYERLDRNDRALETQSRRDPVLARAVELLDQVGTQSDLFALVPTPPRPTPEEREGSEEDDEPGS